MSIRVLRIAAVVAVGISASACSSVPDWVDPTTWLSDKGLPDTGDGKTTDLADIPGRPPTTTPDERKQVADSLAADRSQSNYSAEQLRAQNEQSAAPPPPAPPPNSDSSSTGPNQSNSPGANSNKESPPERTVSTTPSEATAQPAVAQSTTAATGADTGTTSLPAPAPAAESTGAAPSPAEAQADSSTGFKPSSAPPLDPSVAQFATPSLVAKYQQTASASPATAPTSAAPRLVSAPSSGTLTPDAIVLFAGDGTTLTPIARAKVREVAQAFQSKGASGYVRIVGHSSSRTPNMPVQQHLQLIFQRSQDRADAVARELIQDGVPAAKVLVEAVGDSQPVYNESMPKGEEGNRRAEIFLQS